MLLWLVGRMLIRCKVHSKQFGVFRLISSLITAHVPCRSQKSFMGLVSGATCRVEVEFKDDKGAAYKRTVMLKTKGNETEDIPLYTNKDNIMGEVCARKKAVVRTCSCTG